MEDEPEIYSVLLLLRLSQPVSAPKRRTSLGNDDVLAHGTVAKRREDRLAAGGGAPEHGWTGLTPRGNSHQNKLELTFRLFNSFQF